MKKYLASVTLTLLTMAPSAFGANTVSQQVTEKVEAYCEVYRFSGHMMRISHNLCQNIEATLAQKRLSQILGEIMTDLKPLRAQSNSETVKPFVDAFAAIVDAAPKNRSPSNTLGRWKREAQSLLKEDKSPS